MRANDTTQAQAEASLQLSIEMALRLADAEESGRSIATRIYDHERELMNQLRRPWMIERITRLVEKKWWQQPSPNQAALPGFEELPRRIIKGTVEMTGGKKQMVTLRNATLPDLLRYRKILLRQRDQRIEHLDKLIALMRKYAGRSRRLTVGNVIKQHRLELEGELKV